MPAITSANIRDYIDKEQVIRLKKYEGKSIYLPKGESIYLPKGESIYLPKGESIYLPKGESIYLPKEGGILPLIPIIAAIIGGLATSAGAVAGSVLKSKSNDEEARHNKELEDIARKESEQAMQLAQTKGGSLPPTVLTNIIKDALKSSKRIKKSNIDIESKGGILPMVVPGLLYYHMLKKKVDDKEDNSSYGTIGKSLHLIAKAKKGDGFADLLSSGIGSLVNFVSNNKDNISNLASAANSIGSVVNTSMGIAKGVEELRNLRAKRGKGVLPDYSRNDFGNKSKTGSKLSKEEEILVEEIIGNGFQIIN